MVKIEIDIKDQDLRAMLSKLGQKMRDMTPFMRTAAGIMHDEVEENFAQEGRPKWKKSKRAEKQGGQTLQKSGQMAASISERHDSNEAAVGTNKVYAPAQQFGVNKTVSVPAHSRKTKSGKGGTVRAHVMKMNLPARPFLTMGPDGLDKIQSAAKRYLEKD
jgi:phage virion morphogenesis protein